MKQENKAVVTAEENYLNNDLLTSVTSTVYFNKLNGRIRMNSKQDKTLMTSFSFSNFNYVRFFLWNLLNVQINIFKLSNLHIYKLNLAFTYNIVNRHNSNKYTVLVIQFFQLFQ